MDEREEKAVEQAIACGIQRGRDLYTGSCFDQALKHAAEAAGVPLSDELLWALDARLDALVAKHNSLGVLPALPGALPEAVTLPLRPATAPSPLHTRRLEARRQALLTEAEGPGAAPAESPVRNRGRCCYLLLVAGLLFGAYALTRPESALLTRLTVMAERCWQRSAAGSAAAVEPSTPELPDAAAGDACGDVPEAAPATPIPAPPVVEPVARPTLADGTATAAPAAAAAPETAPLALADPVPTADPQPNLDAVRPGMTRVDVIEALGRPKMAIGSNGRETLLYPSAKILLAEGRVTQTVRLEPSPSSP